VIFLEKGINSRVLLRHIDMGLGERICQECERRKLHFSLIDPDKQSPEVAGKIAAFVESVGSFAVMIGGSTLSSQAQVDATVLAVKRQCSLPVILFPSGARFLSRYADAVFFMSLMNSRRLEYVIREQVAGAVFVKRSGLEPISMGYVIVEPGMTVGRVGDVDLIRKDDTGRALGYALTAQYLGMRFFYLEAGSGATSPVSNEMIQVVKEQTSIPVFVGGGIRDAAMAREKARAGADVIVTGSALEASADFRERLPEMIAAIGEE
jgi:phosphoglycerol geranylgeranyltransferase